MKRLSPGLLVAVLSVLFGAFALTDIELAKWIVGDKVDNNTCTEDKSFICFSCDYAALCVATTTPDVYDAFGQNCTSPDACELGLTGGCIVGGGSSGCPCGTSGADHADPYSDHHYVMCVGTDTYYMDCGIDIYDPILNQCVAPPTTTPAPTTPTPSTCTGVGKFPIMSDCQFYTICMKYGGNGIVKDCGTGNYFNPDTKACTAVPTIPFTCPGTGSYADPIDCREYYVCSGTTLISTECCPPGNRTSPTNPNTCIDNNAANGVCTDLYYCNLKYRLL